MFVWERHAVGRPHPAPPMPQRAASMNPTTWRGLTPHCSSPGANRLRIGAALTNARAPLARCYRFESVLVGEQGAGRWRIRFAIPRAAPPRRGFPALWMLDGNRALTRFDPVTLRRLSCLPVPAGAAGPGLCRRRPHAADRPAQPRSPLHIPAGRLPVSCCARCGRGVGGGRCAGIAGSAAAGGCACGKAEGTAR
ncbi:hypothetical protein XFF6166_870014 [Xanthomonas citri pv. fuscans]|nr:hypothetical protein XFF6166_870014 [Xanthomonas citri pv. fuscans]SOO03484.1 hypothetical protein XFF6960_860013 [Xanthomonas citri pv. fuscans]SOO06111.1 hypothetical protein XFF7767_640013 [Xanthomonas citri pv. fuscans]SOO10179.1 hypothetical protein XFF6970_500038 [Xanthomonas citri pv. fuscans]SOO15741.1 hypothetical protein XFF7766_620013 [Xanthomonas citri pv. fuscans]